MNKRTITYIIVLVIHFTVYLYIRDSEWIGGKNLDIVMELLAITLAFFIGIVALIRFFSRKNNTILFIGTGFLGTAFLDLYHAIVSSGLLESYFPSPPSYLMPWSWNASRIYLSFMMMMSWYVWREEHLHGERGRVREKLVFFTSGALTIAVFLFFFYFPLPRAYYPEFLFGRPEEFISAAFFLIALIGYYAKGEWKTGSFDHWLILSLIVGLMGQAMFMSLSRHLYDAMFEVSHLLKIVSYICVLTGVFISMFRLFRLVEVSSEELSVANEKLKSEIKVREYSNKLETVLYRIADQTSQSRDLDELFQSFPGLLGEVIDTSNFYIALCDKEQDIISFPLWVDEIDDNPGPQPKGKGMTEYVINTGEPIFLNKNGLSELMSSGKITLLGTLSEQWLGCPLKVDDEVIGIVCVQSYQDANRYSRNDINILKYLSDQIASAIYYRNAQDMISESEVKYRHLSEKLEDANHLKELLLDVITHDLKNPVAVISGMAEAGSSDEPDNEILQLIKDSSDSLLQVVSNVNALTRVALEDEIDKIEIDLVGIMVKVKDEFSSLIENSGMTIEYNFPDQLSVKANPIIIQVFKNYISNAVKYARKGKKIVVNGEQKENQITLEFIDFGDSIPEEEYVNIFQRSYQIKKENGPGAGIGLAIVKRIAEAHNGEAGVYANKPTGNVFYLKIPTG